MGLLRVASPLNPHKGRLQRRSPVGKLHLLHQQLRSGLFLSCGDGAVMAGCVLLFHHGTSSGGECHH